VNYRANLWALIKGAGAKRVISVASVGSIRKDLGPGDLVIPHQIIDYTWGRDSTYADGGDSGVNHVDFTHPYDEELRTTLLRAAEVSAVRVAEGAVYAATQGPRLETAAEINRLERDGADIVGMTGMPEAVLARELAAPYAALCVVANWAAGRADSVEGIHFERIEEVLHESMGRVRNVIAGLCTDGYCPT
jgi:5'-methylthioadenosine phosphorylase